MVGFINGEIFRNAVAAVITSEVDKLRSEAEMQFHGKGISSMLNQTATQAAGANAPPQPPARPADPIPNVEHAFNEYQNCFIACNKIKEAMRGTRMKLIETDPRSPEAYALSSSLNELYAQLCGNTKTMIDLANV